MKGKNLVILAIVAVVLAGLALLTSQWQAKLETLVAGEIR